MAVQPVKFIATTEELEKMALDFQKYAQLTLEKNGNVVTGRLKNSIKVQPARIEKSGQIVVPVTMLKYGDWVDDGAERGRGGQPPVQAIERWIELKRITPPKGFTVNQFAWAIAKNIKNKGQRFRKSYPFIQPALNYAVEQNIQAIAEAAALDITFSLQKSINKSANLK
jgi:hypothetical protein